LEKWVWINVNIFFSLWFKAKSFGNQKSYMIYFRFPTSLTNKHLRWLYYQPTEKKIKRLRARTCSFSRKKFEKKA